MNNTNSNSVQPTHNPWGMLILCCFLGSFGVHKFVEGKIGIGLVYLFTGGLCGVGWLVDCIRYFMSGISGRRPAPHPDGTVSSESSLNNTADPTNTPHSPSLIKTIFLWIAVSFMSLLTLGAFASGAVLAGSALLALVVLFLPISIWQSTLTKFIKKKGKVILSVALSVLFVFGIGISDTEPSVTDDPIPTISSTTTISKATVTTTIAKTTTPSTTTTTATTATTTTTTAATTVKTTTTTVTTTVATTVHTHSFTDADCTTPKTCICGATEGRELGHSWEDATCLSPKKCSRCGAESGDVAGHSYSDGTCWVCGESDPDYSSGYLVWIPTNGGKKYHSHSGCSQMEDPRQVTEDEAIALGFTPCKRCNP